MEQDDTRSGLSRSVQRAIDVLELLATHDSDIGVTELSSALSLPKSTTHRLLANLEARGLVEHDPHTERYRVGLRLFSLGANALDRGSDRSALRGRAHRHLEGLVQRVGETGYLAILDRREVLYVDSVEGPRAMRAAAPTGSRRAIHCTAVGKVLIANLGPLEIDQLVGTSTMSRRTDKTLIEPQAFRRNLVDVARDGYALDVGEFEEGLACFAAPIRGHDGLVIAAVGLSGPAMRILDSRLHTVIADLRETAAAISVDMGYRTLGDQAVAHTVA